MPLMSEVKQTGKRSERIGTFLSWMLAALAACSLLSGVTG